MLYTKSGDLVQPNLSKILALRGGNVTPLDLGPISVEYGRGGKFKKEDLINTSLEYGLPAMHAIAYRIVNIVNSSGVHLPNKTPLARFGLSRVTPHFDSEADAVDYLVHTAAIVATLMTGQNLATPLGTTASSIIGTDYTYNDVLSALSLEVPIDISLQDPTLKITRWIDYDTGGGYGIDHSGDTSSYRQLSVDISVEQIPQTSIDN